MKKLLSLILCLILCFSIFSCNSEKPEEANKTTETSSTKDTLTTDNDEKDNQIVYPIIDINNLAKVSIKSEYWDVSHLFTYATYPDVVQKVVSYVNELKLQPTEEIPTEDPNAIIKATYINGSSLGKIITVHFFEAGGKIGISNSGNDEMDWYDVIEIKIKPLDFFDTVYTPLSVTDGKIDFGTQKIFSFSLVYYDFLLDADYCDELKFTQTYKLNKIITFLENVELGKPVPSNDNNERNNTTFLRFYFENGSFAEIFFQYSYYLKIGANYYDIGDLQREELHKILSTPLW